MAVVTKKELKKVISLAYDDLTNALYNEAPSKIRMSVFHALEKLKSVMVADGFEKKKK